MTPDVKSTELRQESRLLAESELDLVTGGSGPSSAPAVSEIVVTKRTDSSSPGLWME